MNSLADKFRTMVIEPCFHCGSFDPILYSEYGGHFLCENCKHKEIFLFPIDGDILNAIYDIDYSLINRLKEDEETEAMKGD